MMMMVNGNRGRGCQGKCKDNHINMMIKTNVNNKKNIVNTSLDFLFF